MRLGWGNIGRDERLRYRREKTKRKTPVLIDIQVHPELEAALALVPRDRFTFLQTSRGAARSPNGLGNAMRRWCDMEGLSECTSHGLRKACARRLAEAGATPNMIAAVTGHTTLKEVSRYTAAANRTGSPMEVSRCSLIERSANKRRRTIRRGSSNPTASS